MEGSREREKERERERERERKRERRQSQVSEKLVKDSIESIDRSVVLVE